MPTCNSQILELDTNECVQNYENEFLGQDVLRMFVMYHDLQGPFTRALTVLNSGYLGYTRG